MPVNKKKVVSKTVFPLKGQTVFNELIRTKPLATVGSCLIHARVKKTGANLAAASLGFDLGLIVPKKMYALAVDRNRVRRVLRAQCRQIAQQGPLDIQLLFRIKAPVKIKGVPTPMPENPHSAVFTQQIKHALNKAVKALKHPAPASKAGHEEKLS